jgi:hypothetical protein
MEECMLMKCGHVLIGSVRFVGKYYSCLNFKVYKFGRCGNIFC